MSLSVMLRYAAAVALLALTTAGCSGASSAPAGLPNDQREAPAPEATTGAGRLVARTANMTVTITDPAKAAAELRTIAANVGGFVSTEKIDTKLVDGKYVKPSTVIISVPSEKLAQAMDATASVGEVTSRVVTAEDVTGQVVDVEARIKTMRESIERVRALMKKAGTISEIAAVEREITSRQAELEALLAQQKWLANQVAMAPLEVTLEPLAVTASPNPFIEGLTNGWTAMLAMISILLTVIGAVIPLAVLVALVVLPVMWWRRARHQRPAKVSSPDAGLDPVQDQPGEGPVDPTT